MGYATEFPDMKGLSPRNIQYMTTFGAAWPDGPIAQRPAAQLPWGHIMVLLDKKLDPGTTEAYAAAAVEYGWSRVAHRPWRRRSCTAHR
ncbi:DUF1016 N-terminal domain-containing protein [Arthrobacter sp. B2a2-09]|uniref:DUF1016 N-terminal domain-containing protein n=1 Tax=Arthrobacter sp. B2a2-09 TaxID=2952822 RepID=UPI002FD1E21D